MNRCLVLGWNVYSNTQWSIEVIAGIVRREGGREREGRRERGTTRK